MTTRDDIWCQPAAVRNWARLTGLNDMSLVDARQRFLDALDTSQITGRRPDWMTSSKPGVDRWVHLEGNLSVCLIAATADDPSGRRWIATNTIAPRRGSARQTVSSVTVASGNEPVSASLRAWALNAPTDEVLRVTFISQHVCDRMNERCALRFDSPENLREWLAARDVQIIDLPEWADAANTNGLAVTVTDADVVLVMQANTNSDRPDDRLAITTALSRAWADRDLATLPDTVAISRRALSRFAVDEDEFRVRLRQAALRPVRGGVVLQMPDGLSVTATRGGERWVIR